MGAGRPALPTVYEAATQVAPGPAVLIRSAGDATAAAREASRIVHEMDPKRPVTDVWMLATAAAERVAPSRLNAALFGGFAGYRRGGVGGVLAFSVSERTRVRHPDGPRLGPLADPARRAERRPDLAAAGLVLGIAGAVALSRFLEGLLFEVGKSAPSSRSSPGAFLAARVEPRVLCGAEAQ